VFSHNINVLTSLLQSDSGHLVAWLLHHKKEVFFIVFHCYLCYIATLCFLKWVLNYFLL